MASPETVTFSNHNIYLEISKKYFQLSSQEQKELDKLSKTVNIFLLGEDEKDYYKEKSCIENRISQLIMIGIVFQAMAVEAFCNYYLYTNFSNSIYKSLEKLEAKNKLLIGVKMKTHSEFPTESHAFQLITELFKLRNSLVHCKCKKLNTKEKNNDKFLQNLLNLKKANLLGLELKDNIKYFSTYDEIIKEQYKIDNNICNI